MKRSGGGGSHRSSTGLALTSRIVCITRSDRMVQRVTPTAPTAAVTTVITTVSIATIKGMVDSTPATHMFARLKASPKMTSVAAILATTIAATIDVMGDATTTPKAASGITAMAMAITVFLIEAAANIGMSTTATHVILTVGRTIIATRPPPTTTWAAIITQGGRGRPVDRHNLRHCATSCVRLGGRWRRQPVAKLL
eukprot:scaffold11153_cov125-Isochrysis_galbana.AAC.10